MPRALRVRDEILGSYPEAKITLSPKAGGYFDVIVDGTILFSKTQKIATPIERFPDAGEIVGLLKARA